MSDLVEKNKGDIEKFLDENNINIEVIKDDEGILFYYCQIQGYPTTYVISPEGKFVVYYAGAMDLNSFNGLLDYAKNPDQG